ncbi:MAG TPA: hypothetical protein VHD87_16670 [Acidimicrobiales bacterium]|nr:hypothetical protein [Acidimicrobiales bacterium]
MRARGLTQAGLVALLVASGVGVAGLLWQRPHPLDDSSVPWLLLALGAWALAVWLVGRTPSFDTRWVLAVGAVELVVAVARPLHYSGDVWSYAMYGRIVEHYRANPYSRPPSLFRGDPIMHRVSRGWQSTPSYYGAGFTVLSAAVMRVAGTSALAIRIAFQAIAATCLWVSALVVRRWAPAAGLVALLLNPLVIVWVVNGGHTDTMIALALLGCVLLLPQHPRWAALAMAAALLVKLIVGFAALGAVVWLYRRSRRDAIRFAIVLAAPVVALNAMFGLRAPFVPLLHGVHQESRDSPWELVTHLRLVAHHVNSLGPWPAIGFVVVSLLFLRYRADAASPGALVLAGVAGYLVAAAYILPWYAAWALPLIALEWRTAIARVLLAESALLALSYAYQNVPRPDGLDHALMSVAFATRLLLASVVVTVVVLEAQRWAYHRHGARGGNA